MRIDRMKLVVFAAMIFLQIMAGSSIAFDDQLSESLDWPQFRGPSGSGRMARADALPVSLDASRNLVWKVSVPPGHSSPIVVGDRIFLTGFEDKRLSTLCFDLKQGLLLWRRDVTVSSFEKYHPQHGPASCTPVSDGRFLYVVFGSYGLICYDLNGVEIWKHQAEIQTNMFGSASSPILTHDRLILHRGTEAESLLQSFEPVTGKLQWERRQKGAFSSWTTPVPMATKKGTAVLIYEPFFLRACSLEDGSVLWSIPGLADEPITLPQLGDGLVFTTSYNMRTNQEAIGLPTFEQLLAQCDQNQDGMISVDEAKANQSILSRPDADGQGDHPLRMFVRLLDEDRNGLITRAEWPRIHRWMESWKHANGLIAIDVSKDGEPVLAWEHAKGVPECPTPIVIEGRIYMVRNGGLVTCLDSMNGQVQFQDHLASGGPYYASPVYGAGKIYFASSRGVVTIVDIQASTPKVVSKSDLGEGIYATPALCRAGVVLRSEGHLWRFAATD